MTDAPNLFQVMGQRRLLEAADGVAAIEYEAGMHMCHSGGVVQGGFVCGWIDAAMAYATTRRYGMDVTPMTLEIKISYFAPARPGLLRAEAWIEQGGRSTAFVEGRLVDSEGKVLAKGSSTVRLMPRAKVEAAARASVK